MNAFSRTELLIGKESLEKLNKAKVIIFGVGGVGGFIAEALCRSGVGSIDLVDSDTVNLTNLNRQVIALTSTIGKKKTEVMKTRLLDINPNVKINVHTIFYTPENKGEINLEDYDYVIDAIDTVSAKLSIIKECYNKGIKVISSMGTGGKLDPTKLVVTDIYKTSTCPLARVMRRELKKLGISKLKVVYSTEEHTTIKEDSSLLEKKGNGYAPSSMIFVPATAGLIIAYEVVKDLMR